MSRIQWPQLKPQLPYTDQRVTGQCGGSPLAWGSAKCSLPVKVPQHELRPNTPAPPSLPGIKTGFTKLPQPLVSVLCLPETSYSRHWMASSEEFLSRDPSLTRALWSAGRGGAGVKDDPGNSAWQCSKEKHCPRLVDVHIGQCVHKGRRKTTQEGEETKATGEQGIQAGTATPQQPQRPSPEQSTSFSSEPNSAQGPVFRALVVRRSRYWRAATRGAGTSLGWDRTAWPGDCNQALVSLLR